MSSQLDFIKANTSALGFTSKRDLIENLYLKSIAESYYRVKQTVSTENDIRDRFMLDLYTTDSTLKNWLQLKVIYLNWENWVFTPELSLARADISFKITGFEFIIECKRLKFADKQYFDEGLTRFTSTKYSKGDEFAGIIGFVTSNKEDNILTTLSNSVKTYDYIESDFSSSTLPHIKSSFLSSHKRADNTMIHVYHMFFSFSKLPEDIIEN
jgi:hypothetical protein